ncbi:MAG: biotin/lipoyl-containing protein [bacterium]
MQITYRCGTQSFPVTLRREARGPLTVTSEAGTRAVTASLPDACTVLIVIEGRQHLAHVIRIGDATHVWIAGQVYILTPNTAADATHAGALAPPQIVAPMPGKILQVLVQPGDKVGEGDGLAIVEAMKMEHRITAAAAATVRAVHVVAGQMVDGGVVLVELDYDAQ